MGDGIFVLYSMEKNPMRNCRVKSSQVGGSRGPFLSVDVSREYTAENPAIGSPAAEDGGGDMRHGEPIPGWILVALDTFGDLRCASLFPDIESCIANVVVGSMTAVNRDQLNPYFALHFRLNRSCPVRNPRPRRSFVYLRIACGCTWRLLRI